MSANTTGLTVVSSDELTRLSRDAENEHRVETVCTMTSDLELWLEYTVACAYTGQFPDELARLRSEGPIASWFSPFELGRGYGQGPSFEAEQERLRVAGQHPPEWNSDEAKRPGNGVVSTCTPREFAEIKRAVLGLFKSPKWDSLKPHDDDVTGEVALAVAEARSRGTTIENLGAYARKVAHAACVALVDLEAHEELAVDAPIGDEDGAETLRDVSSARLDVATEADRVEAMARGHLAYLSHGRVRELIDDFQRRRAHGLSDIERRRLERLRRGDDEPVVEVFSVPDEKTVAVPIERARYLVGEGLADEIAPLAAVEPVGTRRGPRVDGASRLLIDDLDGASDLIGATAAIVFLAATSTGGFSAAERWNAIRNSVGGEVRRVLRERDSSTNYDAQKKTR